MDYGRILKRALEMSWRYRALWLFGAILALTTTNGFYLPLFSSFHSTPVHRM
jgi:hypothetical protein